MKLEKKTSLFLIPKKEYIDSTATAQEPQSVKDLMHKYRSEYIRGSNHSENSEEAREAQRRVKETREIITDFFVAKNDHIVFTSGTTDASNFIATRFSFNPKDRLILTEMEHNSQQLTARHFAKLRGADFSYVPVTFPEGRLMLDKISEEVRKTKGKSLLNLVHVSNVTGVINPIYEIRKNNPHTMIYLDMAQSAGHMPINLDSMNVDFAGVSAHKMYGPTGLGAVFIRKDRVKNLDTLVGGGGTVEMASRFFKADSELPARFEPGTQNIEGIIELGFTLDYLSKIGMDNIEAHDRTILSYFFEELKKIKSVETYGPSDTKDRSSVVSFNPKYRWKLYHTMAKMLDEKGISVRDGCFCAHIYAAKMIGIPDYAFEFRTTMAKAGITDDIYKLPGAVRTSFAFYNDLEDAKKAISAIKEISEELVSDKHKYPFFKLQPK